MHASDFLFEGSMQNGYEAYVVCMRVMLSPLRRMRPAGHNGKGSVIMYTYTEIWHSAAIFVAAEWTYPRPFYSCA